MAIKATNSNANIYIAAFDVVVHLGTKTMAENVVKCINLRCIFLMIFKNNSTLIVSIPLENKRLPSLPNDFVFINTYLYDYIYIGVYTIHRYIHTHTQTFTSWPQMRTPTHVHVQHTMLCSLVNRARYSTYSFTTPSASCFTLFALKLALIQAH